MQKTPRQDLIKSYNELMELLSYDFEIKMEDNKVIGINKINKKEFTLCVLNKISHQYEPVPAIRGYELLFYICKEFKGKSESEASAFIKNFFGNYIRNVGRKNRYVFFK